MGCVEALEVNPELAALEPYDIQMEVPVSTELLVAQNLRFTAKAFLSEQDLEDIAALEAESHAVEGITYKLELAYKRRIRQLHEADPKSDAYLDEFLCHDGDQLVGYLGAMRTQGISYELNGLVAPDYRRQGIFSRLLEMAVAQHQTIYHGKDKVDAIQLLCDRESASGQQWLKSIPYKPHHTEYEMYLDLEAFKVNPVDEPHLERATRAQAPLVNSINAAAFKMPLDAMPLVDPEALQKEGMHIFMLHLGDEIIGKSHLQLIDGQGGIFGLALLPDYQGKGYGMTLLQKSVVKLLEMGAQQVFLQVSATNENALKLYLQNGFKITSTMDYLEYLTRSHS